MSVRVDCVTARSDPDADDHDHDHDKENAQAHKDAHAQEEYERMLRVVLPYFGVTLERLLSYDRDPEIVQARHCAMWLLHTHADLGLTEIGLLLRRDHSTVSHGVRMVERALAMERDADRAMSPQTHALARGARDVLDTMNGVCHAHEPPRMAFDPISVYWRKTWRARDDWWKEDSHAVHAVHAAR